MKLTGYLPVLRLSALTCSHFYVDALGGTIAGFLPVLISRYSLTVGTAALLLSVSGLVGNASQLLVGSFHARSRSPILICVGLSLCSSLALISIVPPVSGALWFLLAIIIVSGVGSSILHPESLRAVCAIPSRRISGSLATSIFMLSGFLGFACGPFLGGLIGSHSLFWLWAALIPGGLLLYWLLHVGLRLAVERPQTAASAVRQELSFSELFWAATLLNTGCAIVQGLLPTLLHMKGYSLIAGGASAMLFGFGSGVGAVLFSTFLAPRGQISRSIVRLAVPGLAVFCLYLVVFSCFKWAVCLLFLSGAMICSAYPQMVALARGAQSTLSLGSRMAWIVGGTWGIAGLLFQCVGFLADLIGLRFAFLAAPGAFALELAVLLYFRRKRFGSRSAKEGR